MKIASFRSAFALSFVLAACGGNDNKKNPDAPMNTIDAPMPDAPRVCTAMTFGTSDVLGIRSSEDAWGGPITGDFGNGDTLVYEIQFWSGIETSLQGTFDLTQGNQSNYSSCAICVLAAELDSTGNPVKTFFQNGGSVTLSEDPFTNDHMMASFTGLTLEEVTIDQQTAASTPVAGGACVDLGSSNQDHDKVPNSYTCNHTTYGDGTNCDCMCGNDTDCGAVTNAPVNGCTTGQTCYGDACVTPPTNDTCPLATVALTLGTGVAGTTVNAYNNYNEGLDTATCVTYQGQPEPVAGPDVAYKVVLTAGTGYTFTLSGLAADYDAALALVGPDAGNAGAVCSASPITACVAGSDIGLEGANETFQYTVPAGMGGTYYVIVDSFYSKEDAANMIFGAGTFTITVTSP
jgi:hypothetical protein